MPNQTDFFQSTPKPPEHFTIRRRDPRLKWIILFALSFSTGSSAYIYYYGLESFINMFYRLYQKIVYVVSTYGPIILNWLKQVWLFVSDVLRTLQSN